MNVMECIWQKIKPMICSRLLHARTCTKWPQHTPAKPKFLVLSQTADSHGWQDVFRANNWILAPVEQSSVLASINALLTHVDRD